MMTTLTIIVASSVGSPTTAGASISTAAEAASLVSVEANQKPESFRRSRTPFAPPSRSPFAPPPRS